MTEIEYHPIKKIAVHEIIKQSYDDFLNGKARPQPQGGVPTQVRWEDGTIGEDDFVNGLKYMVEKGIIGVN